MRCLLTVSEVCGCWSFAGGMKIFKNVPGSTLVITDGNELSALAVFTLIGYCGHSTLLDSLALGPDGKTESTAEIGINQTLCSGNFTAQL